MAGISPIWRQTQDKQSINQSTQSVLLCLMVAFGYIFLSSTILNLLKMCVAVTLVFTSSAYLPYIHIHVISYQQMNTLIPL